MPYQTRLPTETIENIISCLASESGSKGHRRRDSLCNAGLISHAWLQPAQRLLFSRFRIDCHEDGFLHPMYPPRWSFWMTFFRSHVTLAHYVRKVCFLTSPKARSVDSLLVVLPDVFPNVTSFEFRPSKGEHGDILAKTLFRWSQLQLLTLEYESPVLSSLSNTLTQYAPATKASLTRIDISTTDAPFVVDMLEYLGRTTTKHTLISMRLCHNAHYELDREADAREMARLIPLLNTFGAIEDLNLQLVSAVLWMAMFVQHDSAYTLLEMPSIPSSHLCSHFADLDALCLPTLATLKITLESGGINTIVLLRHLLLTSNCPYLECLTIEFVGLPFAPATETMRTFSQRTAVKIFRPFHEWDDQVVQVASQFNSTESRLDRQTPILSASASNHLETLRIVLNTEGNVPRVVVHDAIAFLGLFGFSEMHVLSVIMAQHQDVVFDFIH
jgi:hypothetical protein